MCETFYRVKSMRINHVLCVRQIQLFAVQAPLHCYMWNHAMNLVMAVCSIVIQMPFAYVFYHFIKKKKKNFFVRIVSNENEFSSRLQDFQVKVFDLNDIIIEKLADAINLSYDKVNARISVAMLFPEPVCVKASITFRGRKIPNGDFDVIVLSSSDTTLVHKNISKRNICYEAKLLNPITQSNKLKPRKVLCYVGPKQVNARRNDDTAKEFRN